MTAPKTPKPIDWDAVNKMYGAWADRDDIDDGWLDRLRGSWDESLEAIMRDDTNEQDNHSAEIAALEKRYGMTSEEFLRAWDEGTAPDTFETNAWAMILKSERTSLEAFMLPHTNNFTAKDVELLDTQECVIEYPELWAAAKELFPTADDATLTKIISFGFAMRHNWRREYNDYD